MSNVLVLIIWVFFQATQKDLAGAKNRQMMKNVDVGIQKAKEVRFKKSVKLHYIVSCYVLY